jgi:hypothetical protein
MNLNRCITIEHFPGLVFAEAAASMLHSEGIETMIHSDGVGGEMPNLEFAGGVSLLVESKDLDRARNILLVDRRA